jgi:hypothetical protein
MSFVPAPSLHAKPGCVPPAIFEVIALGAAPRFRDDQSSGEGWAARAGAPGGGPTRVHSTRKGGAERFAAFSLSIPPDCVRPLCGSRPQDTRRLQIGDLRFLGLHLYLQQISTGEPSNFSGRPGAAACGQSFRRSTRSCGNACTGLSQIRDTG